MLGLPQDVTSVQDRHPVGGCADQSNEKNAPACWRGRLTWVRVGHAGPMSMTMSRDVAVLVLFNVTSPPWSELAVHL